MGWNNKLFSERGQALVIVAFALIGLIGITGLAVDGGLAFSDRRDAQNAADTAVLAAALAKINFLESGKGFADSNAAMVTHGMDMARLNGYDNKPQHKNTVEVYACDDPRASCDLPATIDKSEYVQVIIFSTRDTFFARIIGIPQVHNRVQAIALADDDDTGSLFDGRSIVSLNPDCDPNGSMVIGGNALITINGGGIWANADESCSFKCTSTSAQVEINGGGLLSPATSFDNLSAHCNAELIDDGLAYGVPGQMPYPPKEPVLLEPPECDPSKLPKVTSGNWNDPVHGKVTATYLTSGYYSEFPPKKDDSGKGINDDIVMNPGTYCIDTDLQLTSKNLHLWGQGVTIWVSAGHGVNINGGTVQLIGSSEDYPGFLVIVEPDYSYLDKPTNCTFEGNALNVYKGAIFAPHCNVTINGNASTPPDGIDSQIIGYNVTINGKADLTINYTSDNNPYIVDPSKTGLVK